MLKLTKDFWLHEFLPPEIYEMSPKSGILFLDPRIIQIAQFIRDRFGKAVTINNYLNGGHYTNSGFRDPLSSVGALFSQHKFGRAIDAKIDEMEPEEIRLDIIANWPIYKEVGLTTIEIETPTWLHVDCRLTNLPTLLMVKGK